MPLVPLVLPDEGGVVSGGVALVPPEVELSVPVVPEVPEVPLVPPIDVPLVPVPLVVSVEVPPVVELPLELPEVP